MDRITLKLKPLLDFNYQKFSQLCGANPEAKLELTATGELVVMSPTGGESGNRSIKIAARLELWTELDGTGLAFDSSTMFELPNGAFRSPDAAWVKKEKWLRLSEAQKKGFPPLCPDFVVELRSPSDSLKSLQDKMREYQDQGARLGWLINPQSQQVEIYRQGQEKEVLTNPNVLSGEDVLQGFVLNLSGII